MINWRLGYTLLLYALLPQALLHLLWRARGEPAYLEHVAERFGRYDIAVREPLIWVHAVSVGETRAAEPLIDALQRKHPGRVATTFLFSLIFISASIPSSMYVNERFYLPPICGRPHSVGSFDRLSTGERRAKTPFR